MFWVCRDRRQLESAPAPYALYAEPPDGRYATEGYWRQATLVLSAQLFEKLFGITLVPGAGPMKVNP